MCSRPEDGLICRLGVKLPLKPRKSKNQGWEAKDEKKENISTPELCTRCTIFAAGGLEILGYFGIISFLWAPDLMKNILFNQSSHPYLAGMNFVRF